MESAPGPETVIDGHRYLYFGGTSYLGLAGDSEVIEAACSAAQRYGIHSATSRPGFGNNPATLEVERRAADFFALEDAFYFPSGYLGNHILLPVLARRADMLFLDESAHYSLVEAAQLAGRPVVCFRHRNPNDLERCLRERLSPGQKPLVLSDGVFPVSGALAPVSDYLRILRSFTPAALHLDDAHGLAVLGENGRGVLEHFECWGDQVNSEQAADGVFLTVCGSLAKGMGGFGGIIPGSRAFLQQVREMTHYYEGASAPSSADAGATAKALEIARRDPGLRRQLRANILQLRSGLRALNFEVADDPTAHFCVVAGDAGQMQLIHRKLRSEGIILPYIRSYSGLGPDGALRFAVCARHTPVMIERLLSSLQTILPTVLPCN